MNFKTKAQATKFAKGMIKALGDKRWEVEVFDNLGWHCAIHFDNRIFIRPSYSPWENDDQLKMSYCCYVGRGGELAMFSPEYARNPDIKSALKSHVSEYIKKYEAFKEEQEALIKSAMESIGNE